MTVDSNLSATPRQSKMRASHLLIKHEGSRNPVSRRTNESTKGVSRDVAGDVAHIYSTICAHPTMASPVGPACTRGTMAKLIDKLRKCGQDALLERLGGQQEQRKFKHAHQSTHTTFKYASSPRTVGAAKRSNAPGHRQPATCSHAVQAANAAGGKRAQWPS